MFCWTDQSTNHGNLFHSTNARKLTLIIDTLLQSSLTTTPFDDPAAIEGTEAPATDRTEASITEKTRASATERTEAPVMAGAEASGRVLDEPVPTEGNEASATETTEASITERTRASATERVVAAEDCGRGRFKQRSIIIMEVGTGWGRG